MYPNGSVAGTNATTNGLHEPKNEAKAEEALVGEPLTLGYNPQLPIVTMHSRAGGVPVGLMLGDVEAMLWHPHVHLPYAYYKSGIANVDFEITASTPKVEAFVQSQLKRFWERSLDQVQNTYDYGWGGFEITYALEAGYLVFNSLVDFFPFDTWVLTSRSKYRGVAVQNVARLGAGHSQGGKVNLWGPQHWPAKAFWFAHNRRYHRWYGRSQLIGAWRPWRRLAYRNGAEEVIDGGFYRFAYCGPIVYYPPESFRKKDGSVDYDAARDKAREFAEMAKAGVSAAFPSLYDEKGNLKWRLEWPDRTLNLDPLLNYADNLKTEISYGIGVPPELLEASETGSGWSGRKVPLVGFFTGQLRNARAIVSAWREQIGQPLVRWNFGKGHWFHVKPKLVLPAELQDQAPQQPGGGNALAGLMGGQPPGGGGAAPAPSGGQPSQPGGGVEGIADLLKGSAEMSAAVDGQRLSSTQFNLDQGSFDRSRGDPVQRLKRMAMFVANEHLATDGRESKSHITSKFGLHTANVEDVRRVVAGFGPIKVRLGKTSLFPAKEAQRGGEKFDVLKVDVDGGALHRLNKLLSSSLEHTDSHPRYQPHITVAYLKPGQGKQYVGMDDVDGMEMELAELVFSDPDGKKTVIDLAQPAIELAAGDAAAPVAQPPVPAGADPWQPFTSKRGNPGWLNTQTKEKRYQKAKPGSRMRKSAKADGTTEEKHARATPDEVHGTLQKYLGDNPTEKITAEGIKAAVNDVLSMNPADVARVKELMGGLKAKGRSALVDKIAERFGTKPKAEAAEAKQRVGEVVARSQAELKERLTKDLARFSPEELRQQAEELGAKPQPGDSKEQLIGHIHQQMSGIIEKTGSDVASKAMAEQRVTMPAAAKPAAKGASAKPAVKPPVKSPAVKQATPAPPQPTLQPATAAAPADDHESVRDAAAHLNELYGRADLSDDGLRAAIDSLHKDFSAKDLKAVAKEFGVPATSKWAAKNGILKKFADKRSAAKPEQPVPATPAPQAEPTAPAQEKPAAPMAPPEAFAPMEPDSVAAPPAAPGDDTIDLFVDSETPGRAAPVPSAPASSAAAKSSAERVGYGAARSVREWEDKSQPLENRLNALGRIDTSVMDAVMNAEPAMGLYKKAGITKPHNEFLRSLHNNYQEWASNPRDPAYTKRLVEALGNREKEFANVAFGLRKLVADGTKVEGYTGPVDLEAAADLYEKYGQQAIDEVRQAAGLEKSAATAPPAAAATPGTPTVVTAPKAAPPTASQPKTATAKIANTLAQSVRLLQRLPEYEDGLIPFDTLYKQAKHDHGGDFSPEEFHAALQSLSDQGRAELASANDPQAAGKYVMKRGDNLYNYVMLKKGGEVPRDIPVAPSAAAVAPSAAARAAAPAPASAAKPSQAESDLRSRIEQLKTGREAARAEGSKARVPAFNKKIREAEAELQKLAAGPTPAIPAAPGTTATPAPTPTAPASPAPKPAARPKPATKANASGVRVDEAKIEAAHAKYKGVQELQDKLTDALMSNKIEMRDGYKQLDDAFASLGLEKMSLPEIAAIAKVADVHPNKKAVSKKQLIDRLRQRTQSLYSSIASTKA